ncbi:MAG: methyltransferase domain-containing protein [Hyphomicrobiaceae bacterium]|nr:methyltransferase domain-containing protein [Hyphomicrobiaceae bacterium]
MTLSREKSRIVARFRRRAGSYDAAAQVQRHAAERLAGLLPPELAPKHRPAAILEIGCGTGLLTRRLVAHYPGADLLATDVAPDMVAACRTALGPASDVRLMVMDGERPTVAGPFDLIASSMVVHWFDDVARSLDCLAHLLAPGGVLAYATIGADGFPEWRHALDALGLDHGLRHLGNLPGRLEDEHVTIDYGSAAGFLASLRATGATEARADYRPLPPGALKAALRRMEQAHGGRVTWHIVYGLLQR